jgi:hypothetical protein
MPPPLDDLKNAEKIAFNDVGPRAYGMEEYRRCLMKKILAFIVIFTFVFLSFIPCVCAQSVPSPEEFFGFTVGADYHLIDYRQAVSYWKKLEESSDRIKLFEYGKTFGGRPMIFAAVSSEANISKLDHYKSTAKRLSLVRGVSVEEARSLAAEGKAIVWIDGGLHATEVAPAQHILQLTYDLIADESKPIQNIRNEVVTMLVLPNPDGMDMVSEWYKQNLGTPFETSSLPYLYQNYIGHDNNRDSFMLSVPETRNINTLVNHEWYPHIFYNHHQRAPFPSLIFIPPDSEPTNPNLHPLLLRWQNFIGAAIAKAFESEGKQGAISRYLFDTWYPGYVTQVCDFHNIISTFSETFLYYYATPHFYTVRDFPDEYRDFTISLFFTNPWKGGWWRLRNAVEYCLTSSKAVLDIAAKHREELMYAKYAMGQETITRFRNEPPYGWIVPKDQRDPGVADLLLDKLIALDLEVFLSKEPFEADGILYPEGTYVLPTSQPFGRLLKTLFEIQDYPDLRKYPSLWQSIVDPIDLKIPPLRTYDVLGWTLPLQMGVRTVMMNSPVQAELKRVDKIVSQNGRFSGTGSDLYLLPYARINSVIAVNRLLDAGAEVFWAKAPFKHGNTSYPSGTVIVPVSRSSEKIMPALIEELSLEVHKTENLSLSVYKLKRPRIAIYQPWVSNMDEGWTRLILENYEFPFTVIHNAEVRAGSLHDRIDVIILPSQRPDSIINGHAKGTMPPQFVGGISASGIRNLRQFVEDGGTLVTLGSACDLPIEQYHLPIKNVTKTLPGDEFFASGLLVRVLFNQENPVAFGMPEEASGFFAHSPAFQTWSSFENKVDSQEIARYPDENIMLSGWMLGENHLKNKSAALEVSLGKGRIILLGFRVQHRGQSVATFRLLFNSLFYGAIEESRISK